MRLAVNYAIDRTAYGDAAGRYAASPFDQYLPPGMPGYEDIDVYPAHPDLQRARDLAGWHPGDPLRPITVYYRSSGAINLAQYQIVKQNLEAIGFDVTGVGWPAVRSITDSASEASRSTRPSARAGARITRIRGTGSFCTTGRRSTTARATSTTPTSTTRSSTIGCTRLLS